MESNQLDIKFLKKQLKLMTKLSKKYWYKAKKDDWSSLLETLERKKDFIRTIIKDDEKMDLLLMSLKDMVTQNPRSERKAA